MGDAMIYFDRSKTFYLDLFIYGLCVVYLNTLSVAQTT
jgi:hypothetical protein